MNYIKMNNNQQTVSNRKRPFSLQDNSNECDKSKIRKTLEGINWDEPIDFDDCSDDSAIEEFKNQAKFDDLNDPEFLRDLSDLEFEMSMNESKENSMNAGNRATTSSPSKSPKNFYGLPLKVKETLQVERNIAQLYEWQDDLMKKLISHNRNMVYCVPTSGGKTLVAELMIFRELLLKKKNAVFIFPFVSIVQEKLRSLIPFALEFNFILEEYANEKGQLPVKKHLNNNCLYVATPEKAQLLLTYLMEQKRLDEIGLIVVDELHMIGDGTTRGCTLESLLLLIKLAKQRKLFQARLLAMSATLNNFDEISKFLDACIEKRNFRPVQLVEYVKYNQKIYKFIGDGKDNDNNDFKVERSLKKPISSDPDNLAELVAESVPKSPLLIFCPSKSNCENVVKLLCTHLPPSCRRYKAAERMQILRHIKEANEGSICNILKQGIPFGIVYHHSGLTTEERDIVESAFLKGILCVIVCTSTLSAGVNLPAQRVIIRAPYVAKDFITSSQYKQMIGRAGRPDFCTEPGQSILMIKDPDKGNIKPLFVNVQNECISSIDKNTEQGLSRLFLHIINLGMVSNFDQMREILLNQTLFGIQFSKEDRCIKELDKCMTKFYDLKLISRPSNNKEQIRITRLGKAAIKGMVDAERCLQLYDRIKIASADVSLNSKLHLIYICTLIIPIEELPQYPNPEYVYRTFYKLNADDKQAAKLMGVDEAAVNLHYAQGVINDAIKRFFFSLIVYESLKHRTSLFILSDMCKIQRGTLQQLFQRFTTNSMALIKFIEELDEFWALHHLLSAISSELCLCSSMELAPFLELPHVKISRAKQFFNGGFKTLEDIARAKPHDLMKCLDFKINNKSAVNIIKYAKRIFTLKADELKAEAERLAQIAKNSQEDSQQSNDLFKIN